MNVLSQPKHFRLHCCCQRSGDYHHHIILGTEHLSPPIWSHSCFLEQVGTFRAKAMIAVPPDQVGAAWAELGAVEVEGQRLACGPKGWQGWPPKVYTLDSLPGENHALEQWRRFLAGEVQHLGYIPNHPLPGSWSPIYCDFVGRPGPPPKQKHFVDTGEESEYALRRAALLSIGEVLGIAA